MEHSDSDSFQDNNRNVPSKSQTDHQSRSNSLMSETSSQPDIHPFFKVQDGSQISKFQAFTFHFL